MLSSFLLFRIRLVRYLMAFWCKFFMRVLILVLGIFSLVSFSIVFVYSSSYSCRDGNGGVGLPSIVLCGIN